MKLSQKLSCCQSSLFVLALSLCLLLVPTSGIAQMAGAGYSPVTEQQAGNFSFSLGLSNLLVNGEAREYVYVGQQGLEYGLSKDTKLSDLCWETDKAWLLGGEATMSYRNRIRLNVGYWKRITSSSGRHTDDDWMYLYGYGQLLQTNYSEGRSELDDGSQFDVNADVTLFNLLDDRLELKAVAGYKTQDWQWEEHNSYGIYFENPEAAVPFQDGDSIGAVGYGSIFQASHIGITYEQEITLPYIGARVDYQLSDTVGLQTYAMMSKWVEIEATDHHLNRGMTTVDTLEDGDYWSVGMNIRWNFLPRWTFVGGVAFEEIETIQGDSDYTFTQDPQTGEPLSSPLTRTVEDTAGGGYAATIFSFQLSYQF